MKNVLEVTKGGYTTGKGKDGTAKKSPKESTGTLSTLDSYLPQRPKIIAIDDLDESDRDEVEEIYWNGIEANHVKSTIRKHIREYLEEQGYLTDDDASQKHPSKDEAAEVLSDEERSEIDEVKGTGNDLQPKSMKERKPSKKTKKDKPSKKRKSKETPSVETQDEKPSIEKSDEIPSKKGIGDEIPLIETHDEKPSIEKSDEIPSKKGKNDEQATITKKTDSSIPKIKDDSVNREEDIKPEPGTGGKKGGKGKKKKGRKSSKSSEETEISDDTSGSEMEKDRRGIIDLYRQRMKSRYFKKSISTYSQRYLDPSVDISNKDDLKREAMLYGFHFLREMEKKAKEEKDVMMEVQEEKTVILDEEAEVFDEKRGQIFLNIMYVIIGAVFLLGFILIPMAEKSSHTYVVTSGSMEPDLQIGDIIFVSKAEPEEIEVGDIITYNEHGSTTTITHRCIAILNATEATGEPSESDEIYFQTKGDANEDNDTKLVPERNLVGKVSTYQLLGKNYYVKLPRMGYINHYAHTTIGFLLLIIIPGFTIIGMELYDLFRDDYFTKDGYTLFKSPDGKYFFERRKKGRPTYLPKGFTVGKDEETGMPVLIKNSRKKGLFKR